jgi:hypothetical protein
MMKRFAVIAMAFTLSGCGVVSRIQYEEAVSKAKAENETKVAACLAQFPAGSKAYVEKTQCLHQANMPLRSFNPRPDLFDTYWATRVLIAERLQAGKLTLAEADLLLAQEATKLTGEGEQRDLASRSVGAQEAAAQAQRSLATSAMIRTFNPPTLQVEVTHR